MTLNPITTLTDLLGKLVIEHGSAVITEKNLAFLRDQLVAAEKEIATLASENEILKEENANLKTQLQDFKNVNIDLENKIQTYDQPTHDSLLGDIETNLLLYVSANPSRDTEQISNDLGMTKTIVEFHINEMAEKNLVSHERVPMLGELWSLTQNGRKYLIQNKLIS